MDTCISGSSPTSQASIRANTPTLRSSVIREVSAWLRLQPDVIAPAPSALEIHTAFGDFCDHVGSLRTAALEKESWADLLLATHRTVPRA
jgi:hypothetical protein